MRGTAADQRQDARHARVDQHALLGAEQFVKPFRGGCNIFKRGEAIDFIVTSRGTSDDDAFRWVPIIHMRHEAAVVHAADGWSRMTRRPGLAIVTGGPGHTNALTGIATAHSNGSPVIAARM